MQETEDNLPTCQWRQPSGFKCNEPTYAVVPAFTLDGKVYDLYVCRCHLDNGKYT